MKAVGQTRRERRGRMAKPRYNKENYADLGDAK